MKGLVNTINEGILGNVGVGRTAVAQKWLSEHEKAVWPSRVGVDVTVGKDGLIYISEDIKNFSIYFIREKIQSLPPMIKFASCEHASFDIHCTNLKDYTGFPRRVRGLYIIDNESPSTMQNIVVDVGDFVTFHCSEAKTISETHIIFESFGDYRHLPTIALNHMPIGNIGELKNLHVVDVAKRKELILDIRGIKCMSALVTRGSSTRVNSELNNILSKELTDACANIDFEIISIIVNDRCAFVREKDNKWYKRILKKGRVVK